ncbi:uncharacterized protein MAM_03058 [Metarhizium album ARSEF 1941]|uniref:DUF7907 domain-containing protein n=1 Tax=Metarhizium album (strain ARSEF 1941) TaxID=1081103 RepID=A0A0B2X2A6_METAS|nr:uncharacterized protein MAM_03058 [Metarhizium album ARSEF 1941]KHN99360.1 hypothetical protein MAM_03058 [Metarhizium album ARSEF 1941]
MTKTLLALSLMGLASAFPPQPAWPATTQAKGFRLVVNVTDLSRDLSPPIHGTYVTGAHYGVQTDAVVAGEEHRYGRIFFVNGTAKEASADNATTIWTDWDTYKSWRIDRAPAAPGTLSEVTMSGGRGDRGIGVTHYEGPLAFLTPETYAVCPDALPVGGTQRVIRHADAGTTRPEDPSPGSHVPRGCAPVRLLPECADLLPLSPRGGSPIDYRFAVRSACYKNATGIDWTKYRL